jgi:hypothetical protein
LVVSWPKHSAEAASEQFDQILDRCAEHGERFIVERDGELAVLIPSVSDYFQTIAPRPEWLKASHEKARQTGLDKMTMEEIDAQCRREKRERKGRE